MGVLKGRFLTRLYEEVSEFCPAPGSVYVFAESVEERSRHLDGWRSGAKRVVFAAISEAGDHTIAVGVGDGGARSTVPLRSDAPRPPPWAGLFHGPEGHVSD